MTDPPARASDTAARLRGLPGLDLDAGLAFVGNNLEVYVRLLNRFVQLHQADVNELVQQAERADHASLSRLAHAIKGGAATLGLTRIAGLAQQLEQETRGDGAGADIVELARALRTDHAALSRHLAATTEGRA